MTDREAIESLIATYAESIDKADTGLGAKIWDTEGNAVFIHPRGTESGWGEVATNFYGKTMGETFSKRSLRPKDLSIEVFGDTAIVVFLWDFYATVRADGSPLETHGRETQVLHRLNGSWKIAHVHYSNMPVTGDKEGF